MCKSTARVFSGQEADLSVQQVTQCTEVAYYAISKGETPDSFIVWPSLTTQQQRLVYALVGCLWAFVQEK